MLWRLLQVSGLGLLPGLLQGLLHGLLPELLSLRVACHAKLHHLQARVHRGPWHHHPGQPPVLLCDSVGCSVQHRDRLPERRRPMLCGKQARDPQRCHGHRPLLVCTHLVLVRLRRRPSARAAAGSPGAPAAHPDAGCVSARVRCGPQCSWRSGPSRCPWCRYAARRLGLRLPGSLMACSLSRKQTCVALTIDLSRDWRRGTPAGLCHLIAECCLAQPLEQKSRSEMLEPRDAKMERQKSSAG